MAANSFESSVDPPRKAITESYLHTGSDRRPIDNSGTALNFAANHVNATSQRISNNEGKISLSKLDIKGSKGSTNNVEMMTAWRPSNPHVKGMRNSLGETYDAPKYYKTSEMEQQHSLQPEGISDADCIDATNSNQQSKGELQPQNTAGSGSHSREDYNRLQNYFNDREKVRLGELDPGSTSYRYKPNHRQHFTQQHTQSSLPSDFRSQQVADHLSRSVTYNFGTVNTQTFNGYVEK